MQSIRNLMGQLTLNCCQPVIMAGGEAAGLTVEGIAGGVTGLPGVTGAGVAEGGRLAVGDGAAVEEGVIEPGEAVTNDIAELTPSVELSSFTVTVQFLQVTEIKRVQLTISSSSSSTPSL